jgi:YbgC/YbaW family acyl-CoA thioester hydrolase
VSDRGPFRFAHRTRVGFDETDAAGIVYYGRYMPYFDRARVEYLRALDLLDPHPAPTDFVMRAQHVEYHAPARFDDELDVLVRVAAIGTTSIAWEFDARHVGAGRKLATARQTLVRIELGRHRPVPIEERFREAVLGFEHEMVR